MMRIARNWPQGCGTVNRPRGRSLIQVGVRDSTTEARTRRLRVGLLGGSFNPAHEGHRHISLEALKALALDQIWWLVSPQNPLKPQSGMAPVEIREQRAIDVSRHARIRVFRLEEKLNTRFTIDMLRRVNARSDLDIVWLMGADNLVQMPHWRRWRAIFATCPIAVLERSAYFYGAVDGKVARVFENFRIPEEEAPMLVNRAPPVWTFVRMRPHPASSTAIREISDTEPWWGDTVSETK